MSDYMFPRSKSGSFSNAQRVHLTHIQRTPENETLMRVNMFQCGHDEETFSPDTLRHVTAN